MELKDNCAIWRLSMRRNGVKRILPCKHVIHAKCFELSKAIIESVTTCPICTTNVLDLEDILRKIYRKYNNQDRERVVSSANRGEDWTALAISLGVHYKTAYHWANSERENMLAKGGYKPKILSEEEINTILSRIEENCTSTLTRSLSMTRIRVSRHYFNMRVTQIRVAVYFNFTAVH
ncbi:hypothetical protein QE152_g27197 [Popillia japonica]|uniref:RING-type domain-containing protein n=1 Tax=Popillia japonica TaxID=7064 RepID=A0AAW1JW23_POPJA